MGEAATTTTTPRGAAATPTRAGEAGSAAANGGRTSTDPAAAANSGQATAAPAAVAPGPAAGPRESAAPAPGPAAPGAPSTNGAAAPAPPLRNPAWSLEGVRGQYTYANPHADLYRFIDQWTDMETYLNVGYSGPFQWHMSRRNHLRLIDRLARGLLEIHAASPHGRDRRLVDIGSGRGGAAIHAHRAYALDVVGFDITPYNARRAAANARAAGAASGARFVLADAHRLPLPDASVSLAWSIESPAHFADKPGFLREAARVLKPGGALAFCDLLAVERVVEASPENRRIYAEFLEVWDVPYLETAGSYRQAAERAGFEIRRHEIVTRRNLDIYRRYCGFFLWLARIGPLYRAYRRYFNRRTGAELDHVREHVRRSWNALARGMIDYGLFWAVRR